LGQKDV